MNKSTSFSNISHSGGGYERGGNNGGGAGSGRGRGRGGRSAGNTGRREGELSQRNRESIKSKILSRIYFQYFRYF